MSAVTLQPIRTNQHTVGDVWDGETYKRNANLQQQLGLQVIHSHTNPEATKSILDGTRLERINQKIDP